MAYRNQRDRAPRDWVVVDGNGHTIKRMCRRPSSRNALKPLMLCVFGLAVAAKALRKNMEYTYRPANDRDAGVRVQYHDRRKEWTVGDELPTDDPIQAFHHLQRLAKECEQEQVKQ